jgi:hypothetical protein
MGGPTVYEPPGVLDVVPKADSAVICMCLLYPPHSRCDMYMDISLRACNVVD